MYIIVDITNNRVINPKPHGTYAKELDTGMVIDDRMKAHEIAEHLAILYEGTTFVVMPVTDLQWTSERF